MRVPFHDDGAQALLRDPRTRCPRATRTGARRGRRRSRRWTARSRVQSRETTQSLTLGEPAGNSPSPHPRPPATPQRPGHRGVLPRRRGGEQEVPRSEHPVRSRRLDPAQRAGCCQLRQPRALLHAPPLWPGCSTLRPDPKCLEAGGARASRGSPSEHRCLRAAVPVVLGFGAASMCSSATFTRHRC